MSAASGKLIEAQAAVDIAREDWGGGLVASAGGLRFVVPVRSLYGRPNPHYFGQSKRSKGATWLAVVSDRAAGSTRSIDSATALFVLSLARLT
jgi:hypothetical protein